MTSGTRDLDPFPRDLLAELARTGRPPISSVDVATARSMVRGWIDQQGEPEKLESVVDVMVAGPVGSIPARFYRPEDCTSVLFVFFHGGGWMTGDLDLVDVPLRRLAKASGAQILSVDYRLAPETKFPGGLEDCVAVVAALDTVAATLGAHWGHVILIGESAGANLAAAVALVARDRGGMRIDGQILLYPVTAPTVGSSFQSLEENGDGYLLTRDAMLHYWRTYLTDPGDATDPYASPLLAGSLAGLPPALVVTAGFDPLRDEGRAYAEQLRLDGVDVEHVEYVGQLHGFFWMPGSEGFPRVLGDVHSWLLAHSAAGHLDRKERQ